MVLPDNGLFGAIAGQNFRYFGANATHRQQCRPLARSNYLLFSAWRSKYPVKSTDFPSFNARAPTRPT
jgi:hypothetical protein